MEAINPALILCADAEATPQQRWPFECTKLDSASIDYSVLDDYRHSICMTTSTYAMYGSIVDLTDLDTFSRSNHGLIFWRECIVLDKGERIHNDVSLFH